MVNSMQEIKERFEKIKDHKPKAAKKLNELGDILASAYMQDSAIANEMWQYIVDLNTADDIANSKFYVAQVFNKLSDRLSPEEATCFLTMAPERVYQLVLHGYDGVKLWDCLETLTHGYIKAGDSDNALICIEYFYEKFDGIWTDCKEIYRIARKSASICVEYIQNGECMETAEKILTLLGRSENQDINAIVEITKAIGISGVCEDYDMLFYVTRKCKEPVEFFDLLWEARDQFALEDLREKWIEYIEECAEGESKPNNYIQEYETGENIRYEQSKLHFYMELVKHEERLLDEYFNRPDPSQLALHVICVWIFEGDWDYFTKYVSQTILASEADSLNLILKNALKEFMDACFYGAGRDSHDKFGRSYKEIMKLHSSAFAESLARISAITDGCSCHYDYHVFIKEFIQKLNGNVDVLKDLGFIEQVDNRSAVSQLKDYIRNFNKSGQADHKHGKAEYSMIMDKFLWSAYTEESMEQAINEAYLFATDDEIAKFFFMHSHEWMRRKDMLSACIKKNDIDRAIELIDMMASTKDYPGYNDRNGRGRSNMLTILYLIHQYDYAHKHNSGFNHSPYCTGYEASGITDEMRLTVKQLVDRVMPSLPINSQNELREVLHKITPKSKDPFDKYIDDLLQDVAAYTTFPKPRGYGSAPAINRMSSKITGSFSQLASKGRVEVIAQIMAKFSAVKEILKPVAYTTWVVLMMDRINDKSIHLLYQNNPEIFTALLECQNVTESDIKRVAKRLGKCCNRKEYQAFTDMVFARNGYIAEIDTYFEPTSENTTTQLLYDGQTAKIDLDYSEIYDLETKAKNDLIDISFHLLTTKKAAQLTSIRLASFKVNGIELVDDFIWMFNNVPRAGYSVENEHNENELTLYSGSLEEHGIQKVNGIELKFVCMDKDNIVLESSSTIVIQHDVHSDEYKVLQETKRQV